jgi:flagellin
VASAFGTGSSSVGVLSGTLDSGWAKSTLSGAGLTYTKTGATTIATSVASVAHGGDGYTEEASVKFITSVDTKTISVANLTLTLSGAASGAEIANAFYEKITNGGGNPSFGSFAYSSGSSLSGWTVKAYDPIQGTDSGTGQATALLAAINNVDPSAIAADATAKFQAVQTAATNYVVQLGTQRSLLGAYQNQMEYTLSNITELSSNLQSARSRVIDTDYASETAALTKGQILQQAATAMLAQANQMPNVILTLLK